MALRVSVSIERATRLSLRILRTLRCSGRWAATISSPSRPTHTTVTWGLPSGFKVTRWARAGEASTALALAGSDVVMKITLAVRVTKAGQANSPDHWEGYGGTERPVLPPTVLSSSAGRGSILAWCWT